MADPWADVRAIEPYDDGVFPIPMKEFRQLLSDDRETRDKRRDNSIHVLAICWPGNGNPARYAYR